MPVAINPDFPACPHCGEDLMVLRSSLFYATQRIVKNRDTGGWKVIEVTLSGSHPDHFLGYVCARCLEPLDDDLEALVYNGLPEADR